MWYQMGVHHRFPDSLDSLSILASIYARVCVASNISFIGTFRAGLCWIILSVCLVLAVSCIWKIAKTPHATTLMAATNAEKDLHPFYHFPKLEFCKTWILIADVRV